MADMTRDEALAVVIEATWELVWDMSQYEKPEAARIEAAIKVLEQSND